MVIFHNKRPRNSLWGSNFVKPVLSGPLRGESSIHAKFQVSMTYSFRDLVMSLYMGGNRLYRSRYISAPAISVGGWNFLKSILSWSLHNIKHIPTKFQVSRSYSFRDLVMSLYMDGNLFYIYIYHIEPKYKRYTKII